MNRLRRAAFQVVYYLALFPLQTGADLAALHRRAPYWAKPFVKLVWYPVRGVGLLSYEAIVLVGGVRL